MSWNRVAAGIVFYPKAGLAIFKAYLKQRKGKLGPVEAAGTGSEIMRGLKSVGVRFEVTGTENLRTDRPVVYIANHMSVLETLVLPGLLPTHPQPTFVVKESLLRYPIFGPVLGALSPIVVGRESARADLATVLLEGDERLKKGMSVVVFPQAERSVAFDAASFNTLGAKLAQRAGVPIIPIALCTDAWSIGKTIRDIGWIDPDKVARFAIGPSIELPRGDRRAHEQVVAFIRGKLEGWGMPVVAAAAPATTDARSA
jgi:1-acyl-sn-glycerol-3-phosphate acyltransferase